MKRNLYIVLLTVFLSPLTGLSQTDKEFWFVAPAVTPYHNPGGGQPVFFHITTREIAAHVTISMPANPLFKDSTVFIPANSTLKFDMTYNQIANIYDNLHGVLGKSNKGFYIKSTSLITIYYEYSNVNNPDIWALKGINGLGTEFYTVFQTHMYNQNNNWPVQAYSAFDIVATEDNTVVTIETNKQIYGHETESVFSIILNKGETYSAAPAKVTTPPNGWKASDIFGRAGPDHLSGCRITTNGKKIAVSYKDDSMKALGSWGCYDLAGDQTVPIDIVGKEYIAMKGQLYQSATIIQERLYIVGTQNGDSIFINNTFYSTLNRMQSVMYEMAHNFVHVRTKYPSYVLQLSGFGCEIGEAVLPPIDELTGSTSISFTRSTNQGFYMNIMVVTGSEGDFLLNGAPSPLITAAMFSPVPGTTDWLAARLGPFSTAQIPVGTRTTISNTSCVFHLGLINGSTTGGTRFGYFSDYNKLNLEAFTLQTGSQYYRGCDNDTVQLIAKGGNSYTWTPNYYIDNPNISYPKVYPPKTTQYMVKTSGICGLTDSASITVLVFTSAEADFTIDKTTGCSPLTINVSADIFQSRECRWRMGNGNFNWVYPDTVSFDTTFTWTYTNNTDTAQDYEIMLIVYSKAYCPDTLRRYVKVYPTIHASFTLSDSIGCHPLPVQFTNTSTGNIDSSQFIWTFGNGATSKNINPTHTYTNIGNNDSTYKVELTAHSPFGCSHKATKNITVHPYLSVNFTIDTINACANYTAVIRNQSAGVDSFRLFFGDGTDTSMLTFSTITHVYTNNDTIPKTFTVLLAGKNEEGCTDTVTRILHIRPQVQAAFSADRYSGCDSLLVQFTNQSTGYKLSYYWDFGDNSTSALESPQHLYINKTLSTRIDTATLIISSLYGCKDTVRQPIHIYPFIDARFSVDSNMGCSPFDASWHNYSSGVSNYLWITGDGSILTSSDSLIHYLYINSSYEKDTTFYLQLFVENTEGCRDSMRQTITVLPSIKASFYPDKQSSCDPPQFLFVNNSQGATSYLWDFGDGATSSQKDSVRYTYARNNDDTSKVVTVTLRVVAPNMMCYANTDTTLMLHPYNKAIFSVAKYVDCSPFTNTFHNASIGNTNTYSWFINNIEAPSAPSDTSAFINTFSNTSDSLPLTYAIRLRAVNAEGCISEYSDTTAVFSQVQAAFGAIPGFSGCHPFSVQFSDSSRFAKYFLWTFSDNSNSSLQDPQRTFSNFSNTANNHYSVKLKASSDYCSDSIIRTITVYPKPKASFSIDTSMACPPLDVTITNQSVSTTAVYHWAYGDGQKEIVTTYEPFIHRYYNNDSISKTYRLSLVVETELGCIDSSMTNIQVYPVVIANFTYNNSGCSPLKVNFTNTSVNGFSYFWNFKNGVTSTLENPSQLFVNSGYQDSIFAVKLSVLSKNNCKDSISKNVTVFASPLAGFIVSPVEQNYVEYPKVTIANVTPFRSTWTNSWSFGDGQTMSNDAALFEYEYKIWGRNEDSNNIYLQLITINPSYTQCRDTASNTIIIRPPQPEVDILDADSTGCQPLTITLTIKYNYAYEDSTEWDFDDGTIIKGQTTVTHTYPNPGVYHIKLKVVGDGGFKYAYQLVEVYRSPIVDFDIKPKILILPDAFVETYNLSKFGESYWWDFGDGFTSTEKEPIHIYSDSGIYTVKLWVTTKYGCSDSLIKTSLINVDDPGRIEYPSAFRPSPFGPSGGKFSEPEITSTVFRPVMEGVTSDNYLFQVFNRWGERIFETTDLYTGWDGYYEGKICKQDVYVWKAKGVYFNGTAFIKVGTVTLLR